MWKHHMSNAYLPVGYQVYNVVIVHRDYTQNDDTNSIIYMTYSIDVVFMPFL